MAFRGVSILLRSLVIVSNSLAFGQLSVTLTPNMQAPQPVGTTIAWTATASGGTGPYDYQFTTTLSGSSTQIRRDYNDNAKFFWTPASVEGSYMIGVTARDRGAGTSTSTTADYTILPALSPSGHAAVHPTNNTLVALFSAPGGRTGHSMRVVFEVSGSGSCPTAAFTFVMDGLAGKMVQITPRMPSPIVAATSFTTSRSATAPRRTRPSNTAAIVCPTFTLCSPDWSLQMVLTTE